MNHTTIKDLELYLTHLFQDDETQRLLSSAVVWQVFGPTLRRHLDALRELPPAPEAAPLSQALAEADAEHDAYLRATHFLLRAYQELPASANPGLDLAQQASALQRALAPDLSLTQTSYADEAAELARRQARLQGLEQALALFPVAGGDLGRWAQGLDAAAARLGSLLKQRADASVEQAAGGIRAESGGRRGATMGSLQTFREALRAELQQRPELPSDLEGRVFRMLDDLAAKRHTSAQRAAGPAAPQEG